MSSETGVVIESVEIVGFYLAMFLGLGIMWVGMLLGLMGVAMVGLIVFCGLPMGVLWATK